MTTHVTLNKYGAHKLLKQDEKQSILSNLVLYVTGSDY